MKIRLMFISIIIIYFHINIYSASTTFWKIDNYQDFNKGELLNLKLNEDGIMSLSPDLSKFYESDELFIWDIKEDSNGNIYLATGNEGIIYKIDKNKKVSKFFDSGSMSIFKLLIDKNNIIYAATLTKGIIYKILPSGKSELFCTLQDKFIWDMKFYKDNIILATGTPGIIYELNLGTKLTKPLATTKEMNITCFDVDKDNNIYIGTSEKGAIYKYSASGKLKIIYQTGDNEIHCICVNNGLIYAGTSDTEVQFIKTDKKEGETTESQDSKNQSKNLFDEKKEYKKIQPNINKVYEIKEDEFINKIIESQDTTFLSLQPDDNSIYIGTGDKGIIYQYKKNKIEKISEIDDQQILCFYKLINGQILFGTGNLGNVFIIDFKYATQGSYISDILDADGWAFWGKIQWTSLEEKGTTINLQTRTGNVEEIDNTWSDWSEIYSNKEGSQIVSPTARFVQFKVNFETKNQKITPQLYSVEIPYLVKNRKPQLISIKITDDGSSTESSLDKNNPNQKTLEKSKLPKNFEIQVHWEAKDIDKDQLVYSVYAKQNDFKNWLLIKKDLNINNYKFDSRIIPDGIYLFKVIADDLPSNSPETHLTDEIISKPYIINNTPPEIILSYSKIDENNYLIKGEIKDTLSKIIEICYSTDAKNWINIYPANQIFDSSYESFSFKYKYNMGIIIIKVTDESGNVATKYLIIN